MNKLNLCCGCRKDICSCAEYTIKCKAEHISYILSTEKRQETIDTNTTIMAKEIVEQQNLQSLDEAKRFAQLWIQTAAQYVRNEEYWRNEYVKLKDGFKELIG